MNQYKFKKRFALLQDRLPVHGRIYLVNGKERIHATKFVEDFGEWLIENYDDVAMLGLIHSIGSRVTLSEGTTVEWVIESCGDSEKCARCEGKGQHTFNRTMEWKECDVCDGMGECPCIYDATAHPEEAD